MARPVRKLEIAGGATFTDTLVWCEPPLSFKVVSAVSLGWPTEITAAAHGVPAGVEIAGWIQNASGPSINTTEDAPHYIERVNDDTLRLINFNTGGQASYVANSATLSYMLPKDLTGFTARAQFRRTGPGGAVLATPTFTIVAALGKIVLTLTPAQTRALLAGGTAPVSGIAHLELASGSDVYRPIDYAWTVTPEGTTES